MRDMAIQQNRGGPETGQGQLSKGRGAPKQLWHEDSAAGRGHREWRQQNPKAELPRTGSLTLLRGLQQKREEG